MTEDRKSLYIYICITIYVIVLYTTEAYMAIVLIPLYYVHIPTGSPLVPEVPSGPTWTDRFTSFDIQSFQLNNPADTLPILLVPRGYPPVCKSLELSLIVLFSLCPEEYPSFYHCMPTRVLPIFLVEPHSLYLL